jgi:peptidyl-prolyl cis-trans isomerase D
MAVRKGFMVRPLSIVENSPKLFGFNTSMAEDKILKLAFSEDAVLGDMTTSPIKDKDRYVIAILSSIREEGAPTFEDAEVVMKRDLMEEKKAKRFINEMKKYKNLQQLAKAMRTEVMKADVTFGNPQITGAGYEAEVIGALFSGLKDGQRTLPLKGKLGVYVIRLDKTQKAPRVGNYKTERDQLLANLKSGLQGQALAGLKKKAEVVDNRRFLKAGIRR